MKNAKNALKDIFEPKVIPKREKDVSRIENKVLSMYAGGMSQRDISSTIEDIYGFNISAESISNITDSVLDRLEDWQNRPLKKFLYISFYRLYGNVHTIN